MALGDKLGPILAQLPPHWHVNLERLQSFLELLPAGVRVAFEFRDPTWFDERVYDLLAAHNAAFCIYDLAGRQAPSQVTADWVYVRLHGPGAAYQGSYGREALGGWARTFSGWLGEGREVYCYFDNDQLGYAVENALSVLGRF